MNVHLGSEDLRLGSVHRKKFIFGIDNAKTYSVLSSLTENKQSGLTISSA